jgi:3-deoxy-7-phosphoheptulonate synthase
MSALDASALGALRAEIDLIDDQLLTLIERRSAVAAAVGARKQPTAELMIRPRRQAEIVERLEESATTLAGPALRAIWRELMGHSLQTQARTELVLYGAGDQASLEAHVRAHFGSSAPIVWAAEAADALHRARTSEAIAVIAAPLPEVAPPLRVCDAIRPGGGAPVAWAVGRVLPQDCAGPAQTRDVTSAGAEAPPHSAWAPSGWRLRAVQQMPTYPDAGALAQVEGRLSRSPPLVRVPDIMLLRSFLAQVAAGEAFLLQGGDCAEAFAEFSADKVRATYKLLLRMGAMLRAASGKEVVHLARIAGQFAKPRSSESETIGGITMPSYRGDAVNDPRPDLASRTPDPCRLLVAHRQAQATIDLLQAYASASYADLPEIHRAVGLEDSLRRPVPMFTSHEALLLNYEQALTRFDEASERWWATSGHMIWIGDRTRALDGAHVEFARGVANPVGLKCGPSLGPDELTRLMDRLDADNHPGRLVLIARFGAAHAAKHLAPLMKATRKEGKQAIWAIDPMHGNTRTVGRFKTRLMSDILAEIDCFFDVARTEGVHAGGVHLEMTGSDVTECLGGSVNIVENDLPRRYLSPCDPRLNADQALNVATMLSGWLAERAGPARSAA